MVANVAICSPEYGGLDAARTIRLAAGLTTDAVTTTGLTGTGARWGGGAVRGVGSAGRVTAGFTTAADTGRANSGSSSPLPATAGLVSNAKEVTIRGWSDRALSTVGCGAL